MRRKRTSDPHSFGEPILGPDARLTAAKDLPRPGTQAYRLYTAVTSQPASYRKIWERAGFDRDPFGRDGLRRLEKAGYICRMLDESGRKPLELFFRLSSTQEAIDLQPPPPDRIAVHIYRILRDTKLARHVKALHDYRCQICGDSITLPDGSRYAEAHHIQPLGAPHNGPDVTGNILCVCPNHHAKLDYGAMSISLGALRDSVGHSVEPRYIDYHNVQICGRS